MVLPMLRIKRLVIISIFIITQISLFAQNNTNSPYTRYGYGEIADRSFGAGRAMGGLGIGLRLNNQINPLNPASYSAMDSLTFLFDFGLMGQYSWFKDGLGNKQNDINGNIEYIAMQFPLSKRLGMSVGILPYSHVGYKFQVSPTNDGLSEKETFQENYQGQGSLTEIYAGLAYDIWKKRLSLGVNAGFLFGSLEHTGNTLFIYNGGTSDTYSSNWFKKITINDVKLDIGTHYTHLLNKTDKLVFGAVFSPKMKMNSRAEDVKKISRMVGAMEYIIEQEGDTVKNKGFEMPNTLGLGVSFSRINKLVLGADVQFQQWKEAKFFNNNDQFKNRFRIAVGGEYTPDLYVRNYFKRVKYRAGLHYSNSYLNIDSKDAQNNLKKGSYNEYGASIGFGFPLVDYRSVLNFSLEYMKVKPDLKTMIDEQYFRITLNLTFNEGWFRKRKLD